MSIAFLEVSEDYRYAGYIEELEASIRSQDDDLANYERAFSELNETCAVQHETIQRLQAQLAAALAAIEAAVWCDDCGMPEEHCRENHDTPATTGQDYAAGCAP